MATVKDLIEDLSFQISDLITYSGATVTSDGARVTESRWISYLNNALSELVLRRPDAIVDTVAHQLTPNTTFQALPSGATRLINITHNLGSDGLTPGDVVTIVKSSFLNREVPGWHSASAQTYIDHFTYDLKTPLNFYVYPKPHALTAVYVEMTYAKAHTELTTNADTIDVADQFIEPIKHYTLYKAFMIDDDEANQARAMHHYNAFVGSLGQEAGATNIISPKDKEGTS